MTASSLGVTTYLVPPITIVMGWLLPRRDPARRWPTSAARSPWSAWPWPAASPGPLADEVRRLRHDRAREHRRERPGRPRRRAAPLLPGPRDVPVDHPDWASRRSASTPAFAEETKALAANQGLYNGFLVAGLVWGLVDGQDRRQAVLPRLRHRGRGVRRRDGQPPDPGGPGATGRWSPSSLVLVAADPSPASSQPAERLEVVPSTRRARVRHSHSLRIAEAKPSSRIVLNDSSAARQHRPEQPVELVGVEHRHERQPGVEVDVAEPVDGEGDGVEPQVALQQPLVDALVVLVRAPADERVHAERVPADVEPHRGLQLLLPGQREGEQPLRRSRRTRSRCRRGSRGRPGARFAHAGSRHERGRRARRPRGSRSAVASQENSRACSSAPASSRVAQRRGRRAPGSARRPSRVGRGRRPAARCGRRGRRWSARRRRRRRPGCRSPGPRPRPARRTRCRTARRPAVAAAYQRASSAWETGGTKRTMSAMPSSAARSASACGLSSPEPDGPPTMGTTSDARRDRARGRAARPPRAAARRAP